MLDILSNLDDKCKSGIFCQLRIIVFISSKKDVTHALDLYASFIDHSFSTDFVENWRQYQSFVCTLVQIDNLNVPKSERRVQL
jgi:hypothetical protein